MFHEHSNAFIQTPFDYILKSGWYVSKVILTTFLKYLDGHNESHSTQDTNQVADSGLQARPVVKDTPCRAAVSLLQWSAESLDVQHVVIEFSRCNESYFKRSLFIFKKPCMDLIIQWSLHNPAGEWAAGRGYFYYLSRITVLHRHKINSAENSQCLDITTHTFKPFENSILFRLMDCFMPFRQIRSYSLCKNKILDPK